MSPFETRIQIIAILIWVALIDVGFAQSSRRRERPLESGGSAVTEGSAVSQRREVAGVRVSLSDVSSPQPSTHKADVTDRLSLRQLQFQEHATQDDQPGHGYSAPPPIPVGPADSRDPGWNGESSARHFELADLIRIAVEKNPTLRQAQSQITGEMGKAIEAGLYPNPTIRYSAEQIGVEGTAGEFQGGIVSQEFVRGNKLQLSRLKYLQRVQVAEAIALAQQFRVTNDVQVLFYEALGLQGQISIQHDLVKSAEDTAVSSREAFQMGQANVAEMRQSNVQLQQARLDLLAMQNNLNQIRMKLTSVVGIDLRGADFVGELEGNPDPLDFDTLYAQLLQMSPELIAARRKLAADQTTVRRELAEPIPNIRLEGGAGRNFEAGETVAVAGMSVRLPLFDQNQGTVQQARADLYRQCAEIERLEAELRSRLAQQYQNYLTASQHISQYRETILPELQEVYRLLLNSYKENRIDWNEVLKAQVDYYIARRDYQHWLTRWRHSETLIDGMLLQGGLTAAPGATPPGHIDATPKPR